MYAMKLVFSNNSLQLNIFSSNNWAIQYITQVYNVEQIGGITWKPCKQCRAYQLHPQTKAALDSSQEVVLLCCCRSSGWDWRVHQMGCLESCTQFRLWNLFKHQSSFGSDNSSYLWLWQLIQRFQTTVRFAKWDWTVLPSESFPSNKLFSTWHDGHTYSLCNLDVGLCNVQSMNCTSPTWSTSCKLKLSTWRSRCKWKAQSWWRSLTLCGLEEHSCKRSCPAIDHSWTNNNCSFLSVLILNCHNN